MSTQLSRSFLRRLGHWREEVAQAWLAIAPELSEAQLHQGVTRWIQRRLFLALAYRQGWETAPDRLRPWLTEGLPIPEQFDPFFDERSLSAWLQTVPVSNLPLPEASAEWLGWVYEASLRYCLVREGDRVRGQLRATHGDRQLRGAFYTPRETADYMAAAAINAVQSATDSVLPRVLDPACGAGSLLLAAYRHLRSRFAKPFPPADPLAYLQALHGVDLDPGAVETTRLALILEAIAATGDRGLRDWWPLWQQAEQQIHWGNALRHPADTSPSWPSFPDFSWQQAYQEAIASGGFEVVLGNPPFLGAEHLSLHQPTWRQYCTQHYQTATGNWDLFCIFLEQGLNLCRTGGITSLIVPNKLGSAEYAASARQLLTQQNRLLVLRDYAHASPFSVSIYPWVYVAQKVAPAAAHSVQYERLERSPTGSPRLVRQTLDYQACFGNPQRPWLVGIQQSALALAERLQASSAPLQAIAQIWGAATVAEAYQLQPLLQEIPTPQSGDLRVINSGTIDPYRCCWGEKPLRYLGQTYTHPGIAQSRVAQLPPKRRQQACTPKLVVASMTRALECVADFQGDILAGKSTTIVLPREDLRYGLALLNSKLMNFYVQQVYGSSGLRGGYLRLGPPQLRTLPVPGLSRAGDRALQQAVIRQVGQSLAGLAIADSSVRSAIDTLVYQLYGLSADDISLIEEHTRSVS